MSENRGESPSGDGAECDAVNITYNTARWCVQLIRKFLVLADAPAGCDEELACRSAIFENVKGYGFGQEVAEPLVQAEESLVACRDVISRIEGEVDRTLIAHIDAWARNWHDLALHVFSDLSESARRIRRGDAVIDYRSVSEDDLKAYWLALSIRRIPEDWFDVMFFIGRQWRFRGIRLDQIENGIFRENRRTVCRNAGHFDATPESETTTNPQPQKTDGPIPSDGFRFNGREVFGLADDWLKVLTFVWQHRDNPPKWSDVAAHVQSFDRTTFDKLLDRIRVKLRKAQWPETLEVFNECVSLRESVRRRKTNTNRIAARKPPAESNRSTSTKSEQSSARKLGKTVTKRRETRGGKK